MKNKFLYLIILLIFSLGIIIPNMGQFPYPLLTHFSDLTITHYPNLVFLKNAVVEQKQLPLWSNTILSGYPFAANPLSSMFYPPIWLGLVFPLPFGINLLVILHLLFAGAGGYIFLRSQKLEFWPAVCGALSITLMPKVFAHYAGGHITLIFAFSWTTWLLWFEWQRIHSNERIWKVLPGLTIGLIFLADPRWSVYSGILWICYSFSLLFRGLKRGKGIKGGLSSFFSRETVFWAIRAFYQVILGLLIASPLLLPLLQYSSLSTRSLMTSADNLTLSLPPSHLLGVVIPDMAGYVEWVWYPGGLAVVIFLWIVFHSKTRSKIPFWLGVLFVSLMFSLGEYLPFIVPITRLPGMSLLRVPPRALFIAGLAFSFVLAYGLHGLLLSGCMTPSRGRKWTNLTLIGIAFFLILLTAGIWLINKVIPVEFFWGTASFVLFTILILSSEKYGFERLIWLAVPLLVLDLVGVNSSQIRFLSHSEVVDENSQLMNQLSQEQELFRIYSPSYSISQQTAAVNQLQLADGVDPMQLMSYVSFMENATGVPISGYSVILPPINEGKLGDSNAAYMPYPELLGLLNVKYIVSEFPLENHELIPVGEVDNAFVYTNANAKPRAWVQEANTSLGQEIKPVDEIRITPNWISIQADGPGLLILSEISYPGWRVYVDDIEMKLEQPMGLFRGVMLEDGEHQIRFEFKPIIVYSGIIMALLAWLAIFIWVL